MNPEGQDFSPAEDSPPQPADGKHCFPGTPLPVLTGRGAGGEGVILSGGGVETSPFHGAPCNVFLCNQALGESETGD